MSSKAMVTGCGHFHAVRFYNSAESLGRVVAAFVVEGLALNEPAVVIATLAHAAAFEEALRERGVDPERLKDPQAFVFLEAETMLREFMVDGMPDAARFNAAVTPLLDRLSRRGTCTVRAYGEMVDVLWKRGNTAAAIRLEALWNTLADTRPFSLLCGYAADNVYEGPAVEDICSQHSHVISGSGGVAVFA